MSARAPGALLAAVRWLHRCEDGALALLLGAMVVLAPAQIVLRNFFDASLAWGDPLLRLLVLWVGLLGALAATRGDRHIRVDALSRILPPLAGRLARALTRAFAAGVAGMVAWYATRLVLSELEFGGTAVAGLPAWLCQAIIPFAFGGMAARELLQLALEALGRVPSPGDAP